MPLKTMQDEQPQLNMTAMVDVMFQLIIFFMVGTSFTQAEHSIQLRMPTVNEHARPATAPPDKKVVTVYQDGKVLLDGKTVSLEQLTAQLAAARARLAASVCLPARVRRSGCVATAFVVSRIVPAAQSNTAKARERNRNQVGNPHWFYFTASGDQRRAGKSNSFYR